MQERLSAHPAQRLVSHAHEGDEHEVAPARGRHARHSLSGGGRAAETASTPGFHGERGLEPIPGEAAKVMGHYSDHPSGSRETAHEAGEAADPVHEQSARLDGDVDPEEDHEVRAAEPGTVAETPHDEKDSHNEGEPAAAAPRTADAHSDSQSDDHADAEHETDAHAGEEAGSVSPQAAPTAARAAAAPAAAPGGRVAGGPAHRGKYERKLAKSKRYFAKTDRFNRGEIKSNPVTNSNHINRPGVRVSGNDKMNILPDVAYRYRIVNGNRGERVDAIFKAEIVGSVRLALNPSKVVKLSTEGKPPRPYVLCWFGIQSSAWIGLHDLAGNQFNIMNAVNNLAKKWEPARASKSQRQSATRMHFRPISDPIARPDSFDLNNYILPHQSGFGNHSGDYLGHQTQTRLGPGQPAVRQSYNINMNLPQGDGAPPVALDVVAPGEAFFVPKGKQFRREIGVYAPNARKTKRLQTWVYGFVGVKHGQTTVPDTNRFGWVPLRTLK